MSPVLVEAPSQCTEGHGRSGDWLLAGPRSRTEERDRDSGSATWDPTAERRLYEQATYTGGRRAAGGDRTPGSAEGRERLASLGTVCLSSTKTSGWGRRWEQ